MRAIFRKELSVETDCNHNHQLMYARKVRYLSSMSLIGSLEYAHRVVPRPALVSCRHVHGCQLGDQGGELIDSCIGLR